MYFSILYMVSFPKYQAVHVILVHVPTNYEILYTDTSNRNYIQTAITNG